MNRLNKLRVSVATFFFKCKIILLTLIVGLIAPVHAQNIDENYVNSINQFISYMNRTVRGVSQNFFIFSDTYYWVKKGEENISEKFRRHSFAHNVKSEYSDQEQYTQVYMLRSELDNSHSRLIQITDSVHLVYKKIINCSFEIRNQLLNKRYKQDNFKRYLEIIDESDRLFKIYHKLQQSFRKEIHIIVERTLESDKENPERLMEMNLRNALDYQLPLLYKWTLFMNGGSFPYKAIKESEEYTNNEFLRYEKTPDIAPHVRFHYKRFYSYLDYEHQRFKRSYIENLDTIIDIKNNRDWETIMRILTDDSKFVPWQLISAFNIRCVREHSLYVKKANEIGIYMLNYIYQPYLFIKDAGSIPDIDVEDSDTNKISDDSSYDSMEGYAINHLVLLLDVSGSMNSEDKLILLKKSFKRLLKILRKEDLVSIVVYSGKAKLVLEPTSCSDKKKIIKVLNGLKSGGSTNFPEGLKLALSTAENDFITEGNNRIILATDGQFIIDKVLFKQVKKYSKMNIHLSIFHFGHKKNNKGLIKLANIGKGNYEIIDKDNVALKLIKEAKAIKIK